MRVSMSRALLALCIGIVGAVIGGGLYEALVIVPLWSSGPPESLTAFNTLALKPEAGPRFWMFMTPLMGLLALVNLIMAVRSREERRGWWLAGSAGIVAIVITTFVFFVPLLMKILAVGLGGDPVPAESVEDVGDAELGSDDSRDRLVGLSDPRLWRWQCRSARARAASGAGSRVRLNRHIDKLERQSPGPRGSGLSCVCHSLSRR